MMSLHHNNNSSDEVISVILIRAGGGLKCPLGRFSWMPDLQLSLSCDLNNVFSIGRHSATKASTASPTHCHGATLSLWSTPMTPTQTCFRSVSAHTHTHTHTHTQTCTCTCAMPTQHFSCDLLHK